LIVILLLYDKFGIYGFVKQRELEKIKELKSVLTKSKCFYFTENYHQISDKSITLISIDFKNIIVIEKNILDNLYLRLTSIINDPFFPENLDLDFSYFHFSKHKSLDKNINEVKINNFCLINSTNLYPDELNSKNHRLLNENFSDLYSESIKKIKEFENKF
jgi:hypothetical protein